MYTTHLQPLLVSASTAPATVSKASVRLRRAGQERDNAVAVVFIVAVAVLLALSVVMSTAVVLYCIAKGYRRVEWFGPNGWKVWQMKVKCVR